MLSHVSGLQTYNSKQPFSQVNGIAVQIYRQASKLTTSPGSLRRHIKITCDYITLQIYMRPAKHRGWKYARLACGRFTRPCGFPSPAIHCLSAENLELPLSFGLTVALFRQSRELESITYFILNLIYGITYHLVCDFGIDLCCGRVFMSQHLRNRFQRNTVH